MEHAESGQQPAPPDDTSWRRVCCARVGAWFTAFGVAVCLAHLGARLHWALDLASHFQWQWAGLAVAALALNAAARNWRWLTAAGLVLAWHLAFLAADFLPPASIAAASTAALAADESRVRIFSANVLGRNRQFALAIQEIRASDADLVVLCEYTPAWQAGLAPLRRDYPHRLESPQQDAFGVAILSRFPLKGQTVHFDDDPCAVGAAEISVGSRPILVVAAHPTPPTSAEHRRRRDRHLEQLAAWLEKHREQQPLLVAGDLNATPWCPALRDFTAATGLRDSRRGWGPQLTWPAFLPGVFRIPIDHVLIDRHWQVKSRRVGAAIGSDHLPVIATLTLTLVDASPGQP